MFTSWLGCFWKILLVVVDMRDVCIWIISFLLQASLSLYTDQATALMIFADSLIENGQMDYVKEYLWTNDNNKYQGGAIKRDLDYIISGFSSSTCDLWEEIRSSNLFWNRLTMKKAMGMGADFASLMGDTNSANTYLSTEQKINSTLYNDHWTGSYVIEDTSRTKVCYP